MFRNQFIHIGTFGKPVGLKGEIKINMLTDSMHFFQQLRPFFAEDQYTIWDLQLIRMSKENMIGKVWFIWLSIDTQFSITKFWTLPLHIRYERLFKSVK